MKYAIIFIGILFLGFTTLETTPKTFSKAPGKGSVAPDFELKSPKGKKIKLSKLKGKIVLIDFWASWCRPCRAENPNVVEAYNKYNKSKFENGNGFEVLSVSLDRAPDAWKKAIKDDGLKWKNHCIDDGGKVSAQYGVKSIPTAFLIDGDGKIIASGTDIRGLKLHMALDNLLRK
ncbi:MAG: peroxiredoxin [Crocinitomicaceae bacterium]|jgi:peroxiredoxin